MGSQMLVNELMVGAERGLVDTAAARGWRAAQAEGPRFRLSAVGAWARWQAGALAIRAGELLLGAGGRAQAARVVRGRPQMPPAQP